MSVQAACVQAPQLFLGHFCSIITSLTVSPDRQYIVSTDRDHKVRVSNMPAQPMQVRFIAYLIHKCRVCQQVCPEEVVRMCSILDTGTHQSLSHDAQQICSAPCWLESV